MIDESLLKSNFTGRDGFTWWIGRVAHPRVWKRTNDVMTQSGSKGHRVKVRIIGYHPWSQELPEEDLPWADVLESPNVGSGQLTRGETMALEGGEVALGFFLDGEDAQQPVVFGLLHRGHDVKDSITPAEAASFPSTGFETFTDPTRGLTSQTLGATDYEVAQTKTVKSGQQGQVDFSADKTDTTKRQPSTEVRVKKNGNPTFSGAASAFEKKYSKRHSTSTTCGNTSIGQITQVLTDFIALTNTVEETIGGYVDPIANTIIDMSYQAKKAAKRVMGILKLILNNVRDGLIKKLSLLFSVFLAGVNKVNPLEFITSPIAQKGFMQVLALLFCLFEKLISELLKFLQDTFETLIGNVVNGPFCAAEQFVSGILAKVLDALEKGLEPILKGLDWLMGGIGQIRDFLTDASSFVKAILDFIGCDDLKCTKPSEWISTLDGAIQTSTDNWAKSVSNINVFRSINTELSNLEKNADESTRDIFGTGEYESMDYKGSGLKKLLKTTDRLTGGDASKKLDKGLSSIEAALATSTLFGTENSVWNACNNKINNPQEQDDLIQMPVGWVYDICIPPRAKIISKSGKGAKLRVIVGNRGEIFSVEIIKKGKGYIAKETSITIVDRSNHGSGASVRPIIKNGSIESVVIIEAGTGYCPNTPDAPTPPSEGPFEDTTDIDGPRPCTIDSDCPEGQVCIDGFCRPEVLTCSNTIDCPEGMICINGLCVPGTTPCSADKDCPDGQVCIDGVCRPDPTRPGIGTDVVGIVTFIVPVGPGIGYTDGTQVIIGDVPCPQCVVGVTTGNGSIYDVDIGDFDTKFTFQPRITVIGEGRGAELIAVMQNQNQYTLDKDAEPRRRLIGITSSIDCVGLESQLVGYVNGEPYYGPFHVHPNTGVKMVGDRHRSTPHDIIYDTLEDSLGGNVIVPSTTGVQTSTSTTNVPTQIIEPTPVEPSPSNVETQSTTPQINTNTNINTGTNTNINTNTDTNQNQGGGSYGY